jgi:hypothetical protein
MWLYIYIYTKKIQKRKYKKENIKKKIQKRKYKKENTKKVVL